MSTVTPNLGLTKPVGTEQYAVSTLNNNNDLIDAYAGNTVAKLSKGIAPAPKKQIANGVGLTTIAVVENIASVTFKANRTYRVIWHGGYSLSVATDYFNLAINTCSTADAANLTTGLTQIQGRSYTANGAGAGESFYIEAIYETGGSDTTVQLKATVARSLGTGTWTLQASATAPMYFYVEDLGDQY